MDFVDNSKHQTIVSNSNSEYTLTLGTLEDLPSILKLLQEFYLSSRYSSMEYDLEIIEREIVNTISSPKEENIVILSLYKNEPCGLIIGSVVPAPFSTQLIGVERAWWVSPEHRRSKSGIRLLQAFEDWCLRVGCQMIQMSLLVPLESIVEASEIGTSLRIEKLYQKMGYSLCEKSFIKVISDH